MIASGGRWVPHATWFVHRRERRAGKLGAVVNRADSVNPRQQNKIEEGVPGGTSRELRAGVSPRSVMRLVAARPLLAPGEISRGEWIAPQPGWPCSRRQAALQRLAFGKCTATAVKCVC